MALKTNIVVQDQQNGPLEIREIPLPDPGPHQVVVRILVSGLCQSQIFWMHQPRQVPVLFGHEGYGVVEQVGSDVEGIREGDPVLVTWLPRADQSGRPPEVSTLKVAPDTVARSPNVYTWADRALMDELYVKPLTGKHDGDMSIIGCAVLTGAGAVINSAKAKKGDQIAVFGAGGVGLSAIAAAKIVGADRVVAVDISDAKLNLARKFGATDTVNSRSGSASEAIHRLLPGRCGCCSGADITVDCVGHSETMRHAYEATRPGRVGQERGGTCVVVGVVKSKFELDAFDLMSKERSLIGSIAGSSKQEQIDMFIDWYRDGLLDLGALITDRFAFKDIAVAAGRLERGEIEGRALVSM